MSLNNHQSEIVFYLLTFFFSDRRAPFTCAAWTSPELAAAVSQVAGIDLTVALDYEIANINVSAEDPEKKTTSEDDGKPIFAWHYDSFPFVCVTMLSDCTGMVGGETAIRTPGGFITKVRGPTMVCQPFQIYIR